MAVLGRQWLIYYRVRSGGGPDRERWEQLKRYLGAERWHLQFILDDILPSLLQISRIIFCVSFILYIHMLHPTASHIVGSPLCVGLAMVFLSAICIIWDKFCPFQSPLSHFFLGCASASRRCLGSRPNGDEEGQAYLHVTAVERAISTSDDDLTLLFAAAHVITLDSGSSLEQLWNDGGFQRRMLELCTRSRERMSHLKLRDQTSAVAGAAARLFRAALAHAFLSPVNEATAESLHSLGHLCQSDGNTFSIWLIPSEEIQYTSPALVRASLAFSLLRSHVIGYHINSLSGHLTDYSNSLSGAGWDSLALMALAINLIVPDPRSPKTPDHYVQLGRLKQVYTGDPDCTQPTIESIETAILALAKRRYAEKLDCDVVLVNILRSVAEIAFNQHHPARLTIDEKCKLLLLVEKQSRSSSAPQDLRVVASAVRCSMFTIAQNAFAVQGASRNFSVDSFRLLERFFEDIRIIRRTRGEPCIEEDLEILNLFAAVLQDLQSYGFEITEGSGTSSVRNPAHRAFGIMLIVFRDFMSEVDQNYLSIQRRNSRRQDPEISWCHWQNSASPKSGLFLAQKDGTSGKRKSNFGFKQSARPEKILPKLPIRERTSTYHPSFNPQGWVP